jgi:hypothetical protein
MRAPTRLVGYLASFASASLIYMAWFVLWNRAADSRVSIRFRIGIAVFFWLFGGMAPALVLIAGPWCLAVILYDRLQRFGLMYFCLTGAVFTLAIGCATSSLSPKPLFIEDQTFLEGCMIAVQRQGAGLVLTGLVFGLTFWLVSERPRQSITGRGSQAPATADSGSIK